MHFTKKDGPPVHVLASGEEFLGGARAIKEFNIWDRYPFTVAQLVTLLGINASYVAALSKHLRLKAHVKMYHEEKRTGVKIYGYTHAALEPMRATIDAGVDLKRIYRETMAGRRGAKGETADSTVASVSIPQTPPARRPPLLRPVQ